MARYNALGRIRKIAVFETLENIDDALQLTIIDKYRQLITDLNKDRSHEPVLLYVFTNSNDRPLRHISNNDRISGRQPYIFGSGEEDGMQIIETRWTQDFFVFRDNHHVFIPDDNSKAQYEKVLNDLRRILNPLCVMPWPVDIDGGNMVIGRCNDEDYILVGPHHGKQSDDQWTERYRIERFFDIPFHRIINAFSSELEPFADLFYHVDLLLTPAGPDKNGKECIFYAQVEADPELVQVEEINKAIRNMVASISQALGRDRVLLIPLPYLIINRGKCRAEQAEPKKETHEAVNLFKKQFAISYNNMLVENFTCPVTQKHVRRLYLPDYQGLIPGHVSTLSRDQENEARCNLLAIGRTNEKVANVAGAHISSVATPDLAAFTVDERQHQLEAVLIHDYKFEVHFIPMSDYSVERDRGASALHCRTKVIQRDCMM